MVTNPSFFIASTPRWDRSKLDGDSGNGAGQVLVRKRLHPSIFIVILGEWQ
jgi:hypothetical protein